MDDMSTWMTALTGFGSERMDEVGIVPFIAVLLLSLLSSLFLSLLYVRFYRSRGTGSMVHRAFPLLGLSVTAIFICIQFSLPLSLGLLGALSIVRFRTPIKEPEEIGFIMMVIATSICCATFNMIFLALILIVGVLALILMRACGNAFERGLSDGLLVLTLPTTDWAAAREGLLKTLDERLPSGRLDSITESGQESSVSYAFARMDRDTLLALQAEISSVASEAQVNVFYNQLAAL